jgi:hypothetical protein
MDYLSTLGCEVAEDPAGARARFRGRELCFTRVAPDVVRARVNEAMPGAVEHYRRNVSSSGVAVDQRRIEEAALCVVLYTLCVYSRWHERRQPLVVGRSELSHVQSHDQCRQYCQQEFGEGYATFAAALLGMSQQQFAAYEEGRRLQFAGR